MLLDPVVPPHAHVARIVPTVALHIYQALRQGKDTLWPGEPPLTADESAWGQYTGT